MLLDPADWSLASRIDDVLPALSRRVADAACPAPRRPCERNAIEFERGGMRFTFHVPDEVQLKIELDVESDERELEIELTW